MDIYQGGKRKSENFRIFHFISVFILVTLSKGGANVLKRGMNDVVQSTIWAMGGH